MPTALAVGIAYNSGSACVAARTLLKIGRLKTLIIRLMSRIIVTINYDDMAIMHDLLMWMGHLCRKNR